MALVNFNMDFTLVKVEAPIEFQGLRSVLSQRRVENAEQGPLHRTARKLGALFERILPPIKTLAEAYGKRVSEIAASEKVNKKVSRTPGQTASPFTSPPNYMFRVTLPCCTSGRLATVGLFKRWPFLRLRGT